MIVKENKDAGKKSQISLKDSTDSEVHQYVFSYCCNDTTSECVAYLDNYAKLWCR